MTCGVLVFFCTKYGRWENGPTVVGRIRNWWQNWKPDIVYLHPVAVLVKYTSWWLNAGKILDTSIVFTFQLRVVKASWPSSKNHVWRACEKVITRGWCTAGGLWNDWRPSRSGRRLFAQTSADKVHRMTCLMPISNFFWYLILCFFCMKSRWRKRLSLWLTNK